LQRTRTNLFQRFPLKVPLWLCCFSQLPLKNSSRISYDTSTLPQCILNKGLDAIMWCRRCCIDNMFRILNNDSEAVLRGITKQRTLECASRRVRTLEKSIWTRGTLLAPSPYPWTLLWTPLFYPMLSCLRSTLVTSGDTFLFLFSWDIPIRNASTKWFVHVYVNVHTLLIHLLNNWKNFLSSTEAMRNYKLILQTTPHFIYFKNHIYIFFLDLCLLVIT